jgi:hypothetical protein
MGSQGGSADWMRGAGAHLGHGDGAAGGERRGQGGTRVSYRERVRGRFGFPNGPVQPVRLGIVFLFFITHKNIKKYIFKYF